MTSDKTSKHGATTLSARATPQALLRQWQRRFRSDFSADDGLHFSTLLQRFDIKLNAAEMLKGTIEFVNATAGMANLDGLPLDRLLASQRYDAFSSDATYSLVFDVHGRGTARLLVAPDLRSIDLEDLFEVPWMRHRVVGYSKFWVSRIDGATMSSAEIDQLEIVIVDDLKFSDTADEIKIGFNPESENCVLSVSVIEVDEYRSTD